MRASFASDALAGDDNELRYERPLRGETIDSIAAFKSRPLAFLGRLDRVSLPSDCAGGQDHESTHHAFVRGHDADVASARVCAKRSVSRRLAAQRREIELPAAGAEEPDHVPL